MVSLADLPWEKVKDSVGLAFIEFLDTDTGETKIRRIFKSEYKFDISEVVLY